jgi:hypothetical protein
MGGVEKDRGTIYLKAVSVGGDRGSVRLSKQELDQFMFDYKDY